jgi:hypothetical protein
MSAVGFFLFVYAIAVAVAMAGQLLSIATIFNAMASLIGKKDE